MNKTLKRSIAQSLTFIINALTFVVALTWNEYFKKRFNIDGSKTSWIILLITIIVVGCIIAIQEAFYYTANDTIDDAKDDE